VSWEAGYDCGYYEGLRNAIRYIVMQHRYNDIHAIIAALSELRDDARAQYRQGDEE